MELTLPKGTRDFMPEEKIARDNIVSLLKETFKLYGYNPLETPAIENYETLASKYAGGSEILKEIYKLTDNAERKLGLRYDLTVPLARFISMNPMVKKPFKRYQIDRVWRDGPIKLGRYREFWQCDADIIGSKSMLADAELIAMASDFFRKLDMKVSISVNNRKLMNAMLESANVPRENQDDVILSIDKLSKIGISGVKKELEEKGIGYDIIDSIISVISTKGTSNLDVLDKLGRVVKTNDSINELRELLGYCSEFGLSSIMLDISLARGLSYYTGTVFEIFLEDKAVLSCSLAGGGRYDNMIGSFIGSKESMPAVGISFGLDTISDAARLLNKSVSRKSVVDAYIIPINTIRECIAMLKSLRKKNICSDMDFSGRSITKNLDYADKLGIKFVLILGEDELKKNKVNIKDMKTGDEKLVKFEDAVKLIKKNHL